MVAFLLSALLAVAAEQAPGRLGSKMVSFLLSSVLARAAGPGAGRRAADVVRDLEGGEGCDREGARRWCQRPRILLGQGRVVLGEAELLDATIDGRDHAFAIRKPSGAIVWLQAESAAVESSGQAAAEARRRSAAGAATDAFAATWNAGARGPRSREAGVTAEGGANAASDAPSAGGAVAEPSRAALRTCAQASRRETSTHAPIKAVAPWPSRARATRATSLRSAALARGRLGRQAARRRR